MQNGFLYESADVIIRCLKYLNVVEYFKMAAQRLTPSAASDSVIRKNTNIAIDVFIVLKWCLVASLWYLRVDGYASIVAVLYLLAASLHTYFYYHVWEENPYGHAMTLHRVRRRFLNLLLALAFTLFGYAFLYEVCFRSQIAWPPGIGGIISSLEFSIVNSIGGSFESMRPITTAATVLSMSQQIATFIIVAVILSKSIPGPAQPSQKE
jgi:hypothetical protein